MKLGMAVALNTVLQRTDRSVEWSVVVVTGATPAAHSPELTRACDWNSLHLPIESLLELSSSCESQVLAQLTLRTRAPEDQS